MAHRRGSEKWYVQGVQQLQQLADEQKQIRWLKEDLANRVDELCGEKNKVVLFTHNLEYEKSELNKRIEVCLM